MFKNLLYRAINGKEQITEPILMREFEENPEYLKALCELKESVKSDKRELISKDEYMIKQSLYGEKQVITQLKNSGIPMLIIPELKLKVNDKTVYFDLILITKKKVYVLKTKNLSGNIVITDNGQFIRKGKTREGKEYKDCLFSPITINENATAKLSKFYSEKFKPIDIEHFVIMTNNKSFINTYYAPQNIKDKVIKLDQLIAILKKDMEDADKLYLEKTMNQAAQILLDNHYEEKVDYISKYKLIEADFNLVGEVVKEKDIEIKVEENLDKKEEIYENLKNLRLQISRKENIAAFRVFNNKSLDDLVLRLPKNKDELMKVFGFSSVKVEKYGDAIVEVIVDRLREKV